MVNQSNFIVRKSGRRENNYYIDYSGSYRTEDIAKITGLKPDAVKEIYSEHGAIYDESQEVYYFGSVEAAKNAIAQVFGRVKPSLKGKTIILTEAEVEYIRQALINEGSNTIHLKGKIKDEIFRKLND
ncbi:MAG: hypothetical protein ACOX4M_05455 [Acetivibrionales bacterium]